MLTGRCLFTSSWLHAKHSYWQNKKENILLPHDWFLVLCVLLSRAHTGPISLQIAEMKVKRISSFESGENSKQTVFLKYLSNRSGGLHCVLTNFMNHLCIFTDTVCGLTISNQILIKTFSSDMSNSLTQINPQLSVMYCSLFWQLQILPVTTTIVWNCQDELSIKKEGMHNPSFWYC